MVSRAAAAPPRPEEKLDGLGNPIVDTAQYYVQDRRQFVGNCVLWWAKDSAGYCCALDDAGVYPGHFTRSLRETDVPWPVDLVRASVREYVDHQKLDIAARAAEAARG